MSTVRRRFGESELTLGKSKDGKRVYLVITSQPFAPDDGEVVHRFIHDVTDSVWRSYRDDTEIVYLSVGDYLTELPVIDESLFDSEEH